MKPDGYILEHNFNDNYSYIDFWNDNSFAFSEFGEATVFKTKKEAVRKSEFVKSNITPSYPSFRKNLKITIRPIKFQYKKYVSGKELI